MEQQLYQLETDPVLRRLVAPLNLFEFNAMEVEIKRIGGMKGVNVWGNVILVDYEYYDYCHTNDIPFCLNRTFLENQTEAIAWVCKNQLLRKSLSEEMRKYLIGKRSLAEREIGQRQLRNLANRDDRPSGEIYRLAKHKTSSTYIRERIGADYSIFYITVRKYEEYAELIDKIRAFAPEFVEEHLAGRIKLTYEYLEKLGSLPADVIYSECQWWMREQIDKKYMLDMGKREAEAKGGTVMPTVSIKDMPAYDPDAEIVSLTLTVPSWISSINRVKEFSDMENTSQAARVGLKKALIRLKSTTDKMLTALRKGSDERL